MTEQHPEPALDDVPFDVDEHVGDLIEGAPEHDLDLTVVGAIAEPEGGDDA